MCVIILKPKNVKLTEEQIDLCWKANSHGAGLAFISKGMPTWTKGYMSLDGLKLAIHKLKDRDLLVHFRMATHGSVSAINTHPFPVAHYSLNKLSGSHESILMHNGIISALDSIKDRTDSHRLASEILVNTDTKTQKLILSTMCTSKFALVTKSKIHLIGHFSNHEGLMCSNLYWLPTPKTTYTTDNDWGFKFAENTANSTTNSVEATNHVNNAALLDIQINQIEKELETCQDLQKIEQLEDRLENLYKRFSSDLN